MDGWTFLSRALSALLSGDTHTARHLAYYAQLRAALSILSCNGIGIFNTINFVVDNTGAVHRIARANTAWGHTAQHGKCCNAGPPNSRQRGRSSNHSYFEANRSPTALKQSGRARGSPPWFRKVMTTWGADLKRAADGREPRNTSSYAAHALNAANSDLPAAWSSSATSGFASSRTVEEDSFAGSAPAAQVPRAHEGGTDQNHFQEGGLGKTFSEVGTEHPRAHARDFLERVAEPADLIVFDHADNRNAGDVHAMLCRALLLLRTSTSIVRMAFVDAGFEPLADNMRPWFELIGIARGFWSDNEAPAEIADLWTDVDKRGLGSGGINSVRADGVSTNSSN